MFYEYLEKDTGNHFYIEADNLEDLNTVYNNPVLQEIARNCIKNHELTNNCFDFSSDSKTNNTIDFAYFLIGLKKFGREDLKFVRIFTKENHYYTLSKDDGMITQYIIKDKK